jgi:hypothetical protein
MAIYQMFKTHRHTHIHTHIYFSSILKNIKSISILGLNKLSLENVGEKMGAAAHLLPQLLRRLQQEDHLHPQVQD